MSDATEHAFLGEEFLTWLWFRLETEGGDFDLDKRTVAIAIDDMLSFATDEYDETEHTMRKGLPTRTAEARAALRAGRRLRRAKLIIAEGPAEWSVTVDGPTMNLCGVKLPADGEDATTPRDQSADRIGAFFALHEIVGQLYELFLTARLRPDYLTLTGEAQAQWMAGAAPA